MPTQVIWGVDGASVTKGTRTGVLWRVSLLGKRMNLHWPMTCALTNSMSRRVCSLSCPSSRRARRYDQRIAGSGLEKATSRRDWRCDSPDVQSCGLCIALLVQDRIMKVMYGGEEAQSCLPDRTSQVSIAQGSVLLVSRATRKTSLEKKFQKNISVKKIHENVVTT